MRREQPCQASDYHVHLLQKKNNQRKSKPNYWTPLKTACKRLKNTNKQETGNTNLNPLFMVVAVVKILNEGPTAVCIIR